MREINMVETYELERKIQDEKTKEIWASIDEEFLDECEKHRQWYLNFTKKEDHPMSYQVKKEIEEWTPDEYTSFANIFSAWIIFCTVHITVWTTIGCLFLYYILWP
tara:strand:- start:364 stop:681 length:318 start_codon:yes stop_codon:yes gene_type:complete